MFAQMCQESPSILPSIKSIRSAWGDFGNPGILNISPAISTIISAPQLTTISRICTLNP